MHELSYFRGNLDAIAARLATRGYELDVASYRALDQERRAASRLEDLKLALERLTPPAGRRSIMTHAEGDAWMYDEHGLPH